MDMSMFATMTVYIMFYSTSFHRFLRVPRPNGKDLLVAQGLNTSDVPSNAVYLDHRCSVRSLFSVDAIAEQLFSAPRLRTMSTYTDSPVTLQENDAGIFLVNNANTTAEPNSAQREQVEQSGKFMFRALVNGRYRILDASQKLVLVATSQTIVEFQPISVLGDATKRQQAEFRAMPSTKASLRMLRCNTRRR